MKFSGDDRIEISVEFIAESGLAIKISDGNVEEWLPKSQIEYDGEEGDTITVTMPNWLALEKKLI